MPLRQLSLPLLLLLLLSCCTAGLGGGSTEASLRAPAWLEKLAQHDFERRIWDSSNSVGTADRHVTKERKREAVSAGKNQLVKKSHRDTFLPVEYAQKVNNYYMNTKWEYSKPYSRPAAQSAPVEYAGGSDLLPASGGAWRDRGGSLDHDGRKKFTDWDKPPVGNKYWPQPSKTTTFRKEKKHRSKTKFKPTKPQNKHGQYYTDSAGQVDYIPPNTPFRTNRYHSFNSNNINDMQRAPGQTQGLSEEGEHFSQSVRFGNQNDYVLNSQNSIRGVYTPPTDKHTNVPLNSPNNSPQKEDRFGYQNRIPDRYQSPVNTDFRPTTSTAGGGAPVRRRPSAVAPSRSRPLLPLLLVGGALLAASLAGVGYLLYLTPPTLVTYSKRQRSGDGGPDLLAPPFHLHQLTAQLADLSQALAEAQLTALKMAARGDAERWRRCHPLQVCRALLEGDRLSREPLWKRYVLAAPWLWRYGLDSWLAERLHRLAAAPGFRSCQRHFPTCDLSDT